MVEIVNEKHKQASRLSPTFSMGPKIMGCAFFYVSSTNHGFVRRNMKIMGLVPILKKQGKIYHTKID